jgi:hypothetical protein
MEYGQRAPLSAAPAHGPEFVAGPYAGVGYASSDQLGRHRIGDGSISGAPVRHTDSIVSPIRYNDPTSLLGSSSIGSAAAPVSTAPVHFAHNLPVKLTPDNYLFWRAQIGPLLRSHSLECFVDGSCPYPPPAHPSYRLWIAQDQAILSALQASLSEGVAGLVLFAATSRDVWVTLENNFSSQSSARSMAIRAQLNELKKRDLTITAEGVFWLIGLDAPIMKNVF